MKDLINIGVRSIFIDNMIFAYFLGMCSFLAICLNFGIILGIEYGHERIKNFTASAGTLIIFDSSTIHRGSPILEGKRYAITNYYYAERLINHSVYAHFHPVAGYNEFGLRIEI